MEHELKCWPASFAAIMEGKKTFDLRRNDRGFKEGDALLLKEYEPSPMRGFVNAGTYTGREVVKRIAFILDGRGFGPQGITLHALSQGYCILGLGAPDWRGIGAATLADFQNRLRILRSIDAYELNDPSWYSDFANNPPEFLIRCSDETGKRIWDVVEKRSRGNDLGIDKLAESLNRKDVSS